MRSPSGCALKTFLTGHDRVFGSGNLPAGTLVSVCHSRSATDERCRGGDAGEYPVANAPSSPQKHNEMTIMKDAIT
ncbi:hypothetical protein RZS08_61730, partial [Arthrospira platensis SPKY1]|nr:hypothetical protein [Arthrospira platensis SPKY1]